MKAKSKKYGWFLAILLAIACAGCEYVTESNVDPLYVPGINDVTANATLVELQQGRTWYVGNCGSCHNLYLPEKFTVTRWKSILSEMTPKTSLSVAESLLVTKYVCKGKQ